MDGGTSWNGIPEIFQVTSEDFTIKLLPMVFHGRMSRKRPKLSGGVMWKLSAVVVFAIALGSCASREQENAADDAQCRASGLQANSLAYGYCRNELHDRREKTREVVRQTSNALIVIGSAMMAAGAAASPPPPPPPDPYAGQHVCVSDIPGTTRFYRC